MIDPSELHSPALKCRAPNLFDEQEVQASQHAFAALLSDGGVVTWGPAFSGGDSRCPRDFQRAFSTMVFGVVAASSSCFEVVAGGPPQGSKRFQVHWELGFMRAVTADRSRSERYITCGANT